MYNTTSYRGMSIKLNTLFKIGNLIVFAGALFNYLGCGLMVIAT